MLQNIRDNAQGWIAWVIVILICIPFALWGIHEYLRPAPKRVIAEVNGVELSERDFQQNVSQRQQQLRAMLQNQNIDLSFMEEQIKQNTLEQMIEEEVLVQSAVDAGMRIGDALLAKRIHEFPAFQEEGQFSQALYERVLSNQGMSPTGFEMEFRRAMLTDQIREGVLRSTILTAHDQQQRTRLEKQQRFITYLIIPANRFNDSANFTEVDIETYYKEHTKQYMIPEKVSIEYVELSQNDLMNKQNIDEEQLKQRYQERKASFVTPVQWQARHILIKVGQEATASEVEAAEKQAQDLLAKIDAGAAFEELAQTFSDDAGSKNQGGDLGWFGPGAMVKPFEEAVKTMKVGEVSKQPVRSQFGFHIIQLVDIKPEVSRTFDEVREQLEQDLKKELAESEFYGQVEQFANLAFEHPDGLGVLAQTLNLEIKTTDWFDRSGGNPEDLILSHRKVIDTAFSDTVLTDGYNSDVIEIGEQHVVVLRLKAHEPAEAKPIDSVKEEIISALKREQTRTEAENLSKTLLEQLKPGGDPDTMVKAYDLNWSPAQWVERHDSTLKQPAIVREAFKMGHPIEKKAIYQSVELSNGDYALVAVLAVRDGVTTPEMSPMTMTQQDAQGPKSPQQQKQKEQQALGETEFKQLMSEMKTTATIKNYSSKLSDS